MPAVEQLPTRPPKMSSLRLTADREEMRDRSWHHMCERALSFVENSIGGGSLAPAAASASAKLDLHIVEVLRDGVHLCDLAASFGPGGGRGGRGARKMSKTPMGAHRQTLENIGEGNTEYTAHHEYSKQQTQHAHLHRPGSCG